MLNAAKYTHPHGKPINILQFSNEGKILTELEPLKTMFQHEDVKYRKIVSFSTIGSYRKGKSFFLDYALKFLYAHYPSLNYPDNPVDKSNEWIGDKSEPLSGFSWRSSSTRVTSGINIWNDIFLHTDQRTGEKIGIVVIDTQGLFDNETSAIDNSRIFALGTLISSIQVLNLSGVVQEDQLQYLQFATEFAKFAASDDKGKGSGKPFQNLTFLIRDWENPVDHPFGIEGGESYLKQFLTIKRDQKKELKKVREFIYDSFEQLRCSLLPYPGRVVAGSSSKSKSYDGNWSEMEEDFKEELEKLIEFLLKPENLIIKKINGNSLMGFEYLEYIEQYFKLFDSDKLPKAQSIYDSTVEKQLNILNAKCVDHYRVTIYKNQDLITDITQIPIFHEMSKNQALLMFNDSKKMGNVAVERKFKKLLEEQIEKVYAEWSESYEEVIKKLEEEKERTRKALEQKRKLELEQIENQKKAAEQLAALEKLRADKEIDQQKFLREKELLESRLQAENERIENERKLAEERFEREKISNQKLLDEQKFLREKELLNLKFENEKQQLKSQKEAEDKLRELEKLNAQKEIDEQLFLKEKEIYEMRLKAEEEKMELMEADRKREEEFRRQLQEQLEQQKAIKLNPFPPCNVM